MKILFFGTDTRKLRRAAMVMAHTISGEFSYGIRNAAEFDAANLEQADRVVIDGDFPAIRDAYPSWASLEAAEDMTQAAKARAIDEQSDDAKPGKARKQKAEVPATPV